MMPWRHARTQSTRQMSKALASSFCFAASAVARRAWMKATMKLPRHMDPKDVVRERM